MIGRLWQTAAATREALSRQVEILAKS